MSDRPPDEFMSMEEAALELKVSLRWLQRLISGAVLRTVVVRGEERVLTKDVMAYADVREQYRRERLAQARAMKSAGDEDGDDQQEG